MKSGLQKLMATAVALLLINGCENTEKRKSAEQASASVKAVKTDDQLAAEISAHREVVLKVPSVFSHQVRLNDLGQARLSAETMYRTLATLESNKIISSQVCFGGSEWACKNFKNFMAGDIRSLYQGFVMGNSLSTGELFKLAANIETFSDMDYKVQLSH